MGEEKVVNKDEVVLDFEKPEVKEKAFAYAKQNWRELLPKDVATDSSTSDLPDLEAFSKRFLHQSKLIGKKGIIPPDEKTATEEDWNQFYYQLGLPKSKEEYKLQTKDEFIDDAGVLEAEKRFRESMHKSKVTDKAAAAAWEFMQIEALQTRQRLQTDSATRLKGEWDTYKNELGQTFEPTMKAVQNAVMKHGGTEFLQKVKDSGLDKEVWLVKFLANVAKNISEDKIPEKLKEPVFTPLEAESKISTLMKSEPFNNRLHPDHKKVLDQIDKLMMMVTGFKPENE
jgi:hypothetical protein